MAMVDRKWSALPVPYAMEVPDRARKERYFDPDFYRMDGFLAGLPYEKLLPALQQINVNPLDRSIVDIDF